MTMHPKKTKAEQSVSKRSVNEAKDVSEKEVTHAVGDAEQRKTPVIGVQAVADFLNHSTRTVHNWRDIYEDFPVRSECFSGTWYSTEEDLKAWRERHIDLFISQKERRALREAKTRRKWS